MGAKVYRSYEEFERDELRTLDNIETSIDDMVGDLFEEEVDVDSPRRGRGRSREG